VGEEGTIGNAFEDAFAVLVARAGVAQLQRHGQAFQRRIGFIDDNRWPVPPLLELECDARLQSNVAMQRLFNEEKTLKKRLQFR
jgi:hypothetical protein